LLVTEPTVSGVHDLERVLDTAAHFRVPAAVLINKADINPARAEDIARFCAARGVPLVGHIPFDTIVTKAMLQGQPVTLASDGPVSQALEGVNRALHEMLAE